MLFGLYAPIPMATVGSPEAVQAAQQALAPLQSGSRDIQFDHSRDLILAADRSGFDLCLYAERHLGNDLAAWVLASSIAAQCERMRALVAVHPGLVDPVMIAKLSVSLDRISRGRMALNVVNGWFDEEFEMFGGRILRGEERYKRATEFISILRGLWENEKFSIDGDFFKLRDAHLLLKPRHATAPEIFSVSAGDEGRDFIARTCDWWFINYPKSAETTDDVLRGIEEAISDMRRRAAIEGRAIRFAMNPFVAIGDDEETAFEATIARVLKYDPEPDARKLKRRMLPALKAGCVGRPADVRAQLKRFGDMGLELILCKMIPSVENIEAIGQEVLLPVKVAH